MAEVTLNLEKTALLIADFYAEAMDTLAHAVIRQVEEKTQTLQQTEAGKVLEDSGGDG